MSRQGEGTGGGRTVGSLRIHFGMVCVVSLLLAGTLGPRAAAQERSAADVAAELANPNNSLGSLAFLFDYANYGGDLPDADGQNGFKAAFQPILPYPLAKGTNLFLRPLIPLLVSQPTYVNGGFDSRGVALGDIGFDFAVGHNFPNGLTLVGGVVGTMPTATDSIVGNHQWLLGPEALLGWGGGKTLAFVGVLVTQSWRIGGANQASTSITGGQYFYVVNLGNAWQIAANPTWAYNHNAPEGSELTLPLGTGIARTVMLGKTPLKLGLQYWYYVSRPDAFGTRHTVRLQVAPVIPLPW